MEQVERLLSSYGFTVHTEIQRETAIEREGHGEQQQEGALADVYVAFTPGAAQLYYVYATRERP